MIKYNPKINYLLKIFKRFEKEGRKFLRTRTNGGYYCEYWELTEMIKILNQYNHNLPSFSKLQKYLKEEKNVIETMEIKDFDKMQAFCDKFKLKWCTNKPMVFDGNLRSQNIYLVYDIKMNSFMRRFSPSNAKSTRKYLTEEEFYEWYPLFLKKLKG